MGPPLKPFLKISRRQQRRRIRALLQIDNNNLSYHANATNNIVSSPTSPSFSSPTTRASSPDDVHHKMISFDNLERFDNVENLNTLIDEKSALTDTDIQIKVQNKSNIRHTDLRAFLAHWAIKNKVPQSVVNELLTELKKFGHPELSSDSRTLCNTPNRIEIQNLAGGTYAHYGLERALKEQLQYIRNCNDKNPVTLQININIDGLPLFKSSRNQFWPILGKIVGTHQFVEPFVIAMFHGKGKPSSVTQFLQPFIAEYTNLNSEGFMYKNRRYFVQLNAVLADTPARNFITCFPAHNSRCAKCVQSGETISGRRLFLEKDSPLRINATFREGLPVAYQNIISPFENIGVDMIKQFPFDYMHLLCLGTMKKLVLIWIHDMGKSMDASTKLIAFNDFYCSFAKFVPTEFSRSPRSLEEVTQWKATEFRLLLLYLGPAVLQYFLSKSHMIHFNALNCAVRILCDPRECIRNNRYAQDLMIFFVDNMELLYGKETLIYNVHNLIHISTDVLNHGPLDSFSCFPFENFLQKIKLMIKGGAQPLAQVMKRITERSIHLLPRANLINNYTKEKIN